MKYKCYRCDICGVEMGDGDIQFRVFLPRKPKVYFGVPIVGMRRLDICDDCGARLEAEIKLAREEQRQ